MYFAIGLAIVLLANWIMYLNELRRRATSDKLFEEDDLKTGAIINTVLLGVALICTFMLYRSACAY
jgi:hypothetical protein